jgi:Trypsin-like peptidase domain
MRRPLLTSLPLVLSLLASPRPAFAQPDGTSPLTTREIFARASASVVTILAPTNQGSGVIIDPSGIVATSLHVVRNDSTATIKLANGEAYDDVRVIDIDPRRDLAVLKIKGGSFRAAELGDSSALQVGDPVVAIGSPLGFAQTASQGIVSAKRQADGYWEIQTTAPLSHGSSGGGLFDGRGRLVGLTYRGLEEGANVGFAVPTDYLRPLVSATDGFPLAELKGRIPPQTPNFGPVLSDLSSVPVLATVYLNRQGMRALVEQRGPRLRVTFRTKDGDITGHADLAWNPSLEAFDGSARTTASCGRRSKVRMAEAPLKFPQLFVISPTILRTRWLRPDQVDCDRDAVATSSWQEDIWTTPSRDPI